MSLPSRGQVAFAQRLLARQPQHLLCELRGHGAQRKYFTVGTDSGGVRPCRGLTRVLAQLLAPEVQTRGARTLRPQQVLEHHMPVRCTCRLRRQFMVHGSLVHAHINMLVQQFISTGQFDTRHADLCAVEVIKNLLRIRLIPVASEYAVWAKSVATMVDVVCVDANGKFVLIEVKTGYGASDEAQYLNAFDGIDRRLKLVVGVFTQHAIQAAFPARIMREWGLPVSKVYIMRVCSDGVIKTYEVTRIGRRLISTLWNEIIQ